jgi:hypothetical protein
MDDKEKTFLEKFADTVATVVGEAAKAAVMPTRNEEEETVAAKANEQMYLGDAAVAPEAAMAQIAPEKRNTTPKRANKRAAKSAKTAKAPAKKAAKKTAKKSAPKTSAKKATKTSPAKKTKKAAPKKSAKKGKKSKRA